MKRDVYGRKVMVSDEGATVVLVGFCRQESTRSSVIYALVIYHSGLVLIY